MKNYIEPQDVLTVTAPAAVTSGELVQVGSLIGVAVTDAASGAAVPIATEGVFTLPKVSTDDIAQGDPLYWNATAGELTKTPGTDSKPLVGVAIAAAGNGAAVVSCRLVLTLATGPSA